MKCTALALFALALVAPAGLVSAGSSSKTCHRRHHQRIASAARASSNSSSEYTSAYSSYEATKTAAASSSSNNNYDSQPTSGTSYSNSSSSSSSKNWGMPDWGVKVRPLVYSEGPSTATDLVSGAQANGYVPGHRHFTHLRRTDTDIKGCTLGSCLTMVRFLCVLYGLWLMSGRVS